MSNDYTQHQTMGEQMRAEELSLRATIPPAEVPGYRLERLLGQGAFGQVWVGKNLNTGRTVAVKFYLHRGGVNWSQLSREVKHLVSMAANRYIVQVLEVGWDAEPPYYVMEYLENGSLEDLIRARGAMPISECVEIFSDIASGLNHSHGKGVLHCDLKPANVLLDQDMRPRLADFGQSRMSHEQTPSLGTMFYMAPEQADLNAVPDARWDVYALGAILYTMMVGCPPYRTPHMVTNLDSAPNLPDRLKRYRESILRASTPRLHSKVRGVDRALIQMIDRCLAKRPEDRFANVEQLLEALQRRELGRFRRPLMLLGIVGPLLLLAVMGLFSWRGIGLAVNKNSQQLREWALRSNQFAAKFAARTLETEISSLFHLVEEESRRTEFRELLDDCVAAAGPSLLESLATGHTSVDLKAKLVTLTERESLQKYMQNRFDGRFGSLSSAKRSAFFNSFFVTDRFGTQLVNVFDTKNETSPVGENFAFRSYFNGLLQDLPESTDRRSIRPTQRTQISVPFRSMVTGRWKIAICTPIRGKPNENQTESEILGVLAITINLGDFELLAKPANEDGAANRFAVLAAGHRDMQLGTILQHPFLRERERMNRNEPAVSNNSNHIQIDAEQFSSLQSQGMFDYVDPVSRLPEGKSYTGKWIAALESIDLAGIDNHPDEGAPEISQAVNPIGGTMSLWVLVQERNNAVIAPVQALGRELSREGLIALVAILFVISVLWYFVLRILRLPDQLPISSKPRGAGDTHSATDATVSVE